MNKIYTMLVMIMVLLGGCTTSKETQTTTPQAQLPEQPAPPAQQIPSTPPTTPVTTPAAAPQQEVPVTPPAAAPQVVAVDIKSFKFAPTDVTINAGDSVVWTNQDSAPHTIKMTSADIDESDPLGKGETFSLTFEKPGTYSYICGVHPSMKGSVTVK